jgi:N-carbamoyl-L-amino-acid hydrolase
MRDFMSMWESIEGIGRNPGSGGYRRFVWNDADHALREWFADQAEHRMLDLHVDRNGNQWAWWGDPAAGNALAVGSHLDSVPEGGAFDGPLGVVSAFAAVDRLRQHGVRPVRPVAVVNFVDEEGARFGVACAGSRLLTGTLDPATARSLRDRDGRTMDEVLRRAGRDPGELGRDDQLLAAIGSFVELHVEQGQGLVEQDAAVGVASAIWPHGRYRLEFTGAANHAGTTRMSDRHDPMLTYAMTALAANKQARLAGARATFGRLEVEPNGTNAIPSRVLAWLDARAADEDTLTALLSEVERQAAARAARDGTGVHLVAESVAPPVRFDRALRVRLARLLGGVPELPTGAGHDAGVLSGAGIPAAMLFVRNPTGVSHAPDEHAEEGDCLAGVDALATVLADLAVDGRADRR